MFNENYTVTLSNSCGSKHKYSVLATRIGYNPILAGFHISISFQLWVIPLYAAILYAKWYLEKF